MASEPYALAQDAASAIRTFVGEEWYDTTEGVPYFQEILGYLPPLSLIKSLFITEAMKTPGVASVQCYFASFDSKSRTLSGQVQVTSSNPDATQQVSSFFRVSLPKPAVVPPVLPRATVFNAIV